MPYCIIMPYFRSCSNGFLIPRHEFEILANRHHEAWTEMTFDFYMAGMDAYKI